MAYIHGQSKTRLHNTWRKMKDRCKNPNNERYHCYGGRGIKVCPEWESNFVTFYDWAMAHGYEDHLTIERIDVNGDYGPGNCTWITKEEQCLNKQATIYVTINGVRNTLKAWGKLYQIPYKTIHSRYDRNWRGERLIQPTRKKASNFAAIIT